MVREGDLCYLIPKKSITDKAIILDLDETCVHTAEEKEKMTKTILNNPNLDGDIYTLELDDGDFKAWGTKRPHLDEFLLFCFTYFKHVCVWSAGQKDYVHAIVDIIFEQFRDPYIVFTFDDCVQNEEGDWIKPLSKFFEHPKAKGLITPENTLIIDDRDYTFERNKGNGVLIPPYAPKNSREIKKEDNHLHRLRGWLMCESCRFCDDVSEIRKERIFKQKPETYSEKLSEECNLR